MRLYICVYGCWKLCNVCVGQMACGSNPKWNRPSFVGDIMTYLEWFLEGLVGFTLFPWFVQQSGTFQKQFFLFCWMGICVRKRLCPFLKDTKSISLSTKVSARKSRFGTCQGNWAKRNLFVCFHFCSFFVLLLCASLAFAVCAFIVKRFIFLKWWILIWYLSVFLILFLQVLPFPIPKLTIM